MENTVVVAAGATRSEIAPSFHLVPMQGPTRTAQRYALGAKQHGAWNWMRAAESEASARAWCNQVYNHMMVHMQKMAMGLEPEDDHLGAIGWAQTQLCWFEEVFGKRWTQLDPTRTEPSGVLLEKGDLR